MAEIQKIGRHTYHRLTNEEALKEFGSSLVFVGSRPASLEQAATAGKKQSPQHELLSESLSKIRGVPSR